MQMQVRRMKYHVNGMRCLRELKRYDRLCKFPSLTLTIIVGLSLLYYIQLENVDACISSENVLYERKYSRLFISILEHGSFLHLCYNMISFLIKGRVLETRYRSAHFVLLLVTISALTNVIYVGLGYGLSNLLQDGYYMQSCAMGFSGVLFALKVLTSYKSPPRMECPHGPHELPPYSCASWTELFLIHLLVPDASFMAHLAGILAGLLYNNTPVGILMDEFVMALLGVPIKRYTCGGP